MTRRKIITLPVDDELISMLKQYSHMVDAPVTRFIRHAIRFYMRSLDKDPAVHLVDVSSTKTN